MRELSRRILLWLYGQDESAGRTGSYSDADIQKALGVSADECNLGLKELLSSRLVTYVAGVIGACWRV